MLSFPWLRKGGLAVYIGHGENFLSNGLLYMFVAFVVSGPINYLLQIYLRNF